MGLWARLTGRVSAEEKQQAVELSQMGSSERSTAEESPFEVALDEETLGRLGGPDVPDESDELGKLLEGPTS